MSDPLFQTLIERTDGGLGWADFVSEPSTLEQLAVLKKAVGWSAEQPAVKCLFYGPAGTGKTLAARLVGAECRREVYRIDLSALASKYMGETEKNLSRVFASAEREGLILLFDEADGLFGRRTDVKDSHDRYANMDTSSLLRRIEAFDGVVLLTTTLRANIDEAFARRLHSTIEFFMPGPLDRARLWRSAIPKMVALGADVDLDRLAEQHELSGGAITSAVRYAVLRGLSGRADVLSLAHISEGIRNELRSSTPP